jgi:peptidyl-prolyl cis-trans isomerase D
MLKLFRRFAKSSAGPIILALVMFALLILGQAGGVRDVLLGLTEKSVVQAGSRTISVQEFQKIFADRKRNYEQQAQQAFPLEEALKAGVDKQLVDGLAADTAYSEMLAKSGVRPTDEVVAIELRRAAESGQDPSLSQMFDAVTGKFNVNLFNNFLYQQGMTEDAFNRRMRDTIANQEFGSAIAASFRTPAIYSTIAATLLLEKRDISYFVIGLDKVAQPAPPTDAQLNNLIQENRDRLMLPERRKLTLVRFSAKALAPSMPVDPAAVEQEFKVKAASYGKPELRSLVEIPLNDPATAAQVQARLTRGEDPTAVAKSIGVDAVSYVDQPQSAIADAKAGAAAFALKEGQVSGPVQGDFKTVVLKVTKVTPGVAPSLDAARPQIEADLRQQAAVDKVYDLSQKYEDARDGGADMAAAAAKAGVTTLSVGPVTADGKDPATGQPNPLLSAKLLKTAFGLAQGADSDLEQDTDKGEYYVVHVDQVIAPSPPSLNDPGVRPQLIQAYYQQTILSALRAKADAAIKAINGGASMESVAAGLGSQVVHQGDLQRIGAQQLQQSFGQDLVGQIFGAKPHDLFTAGSDALRGLVVARLDNIRPADPKAAAQLVWQVRQRGDPAYLDGLSEAVHSAAVATIKPRTNLDLADAAMGADAAMLARVHPKAGAAPGSGLAP